MQREQWQFLLSSQGRSLLAQETARPLTDQNHLARASRLRQALPAEQAQAVLEMAWLRQRAAAKFSRAEQMFFTRAALEQASAEVIAAYRAKRFFAAGVELVADLGCGIGGDALAMAAEATVVAVDRQWLRLAMARENCRVYGRAARFEPLQADLLELPPLGVQAVFFDPARRDAQGRRLHAVEQYQPPLSLVDSWRRTTPHAAVKISPAVEYGEVPVEAELEFISVGGELREGVLWYGDMRRGEGQRATLLPGGDTLAEANFPGTAVAVTAPRAFLYEPDGAVIRAHLVQTLARQLSATQIDEEIAYLTADHRVGTPFARVFGVEDWLPFQLKQLRATLRERGVGEVTIKKRGSPLDPLTLQKQLRLRGTEERVLFLTRVQGQPAVIIGRDLSRE